MKTQILFLLLAGCFLALAAWLVHVPNPAQADEIPEKYRETVNKGLEFLVKCQSKDGHWEGDGGQHPVAMTGLAGLALLMERTRSGKLSIVEYVGKYSASIGKAADWLMARSRRDGLIFSEHPSESARYMQGHGLATLFLVGVYDDEPDKVRQEKLENVLKSAVKYIVKAQSTQGGWYQTSKVEGHDLDLISASVIQIQALQAAKNFVAVPDEAISDAQEYLEMALAKFEKGAKPGQDRSRPAETATSLAGFIKQSRGRGSLGPDPTRIQVELRKKWFKYCQTEVPMARAIQFGRDELTHYYYAQAVFNFGPDVWSSYRTPMFDHLQSSQNKDGSWPAPASQEGISVGPVYAAAVWCTILQLDKTSHPLMRPPEPVQA